MDLLAGVTIIHKKSKKKKSKKSKYTSNEISSSDINEASPDLPLKRKEEAPSKGQALPLEREAWMTTPMERPVEVEDPALAVARQEKEAAAAQITAEITAGLREPSTQRLYGLDSTGTNIKNARPIVGDGGASWKRKMLLRASQRAQEEGVSVHEVVAERYGSYSDLQKEVHSGKKNEVAHKNDTYDKKRRRVDEERSNTRKIQEPSKDAQVLSTFTNRIQLALGSSGPCASANALGINYDSLLDNAEKASLATKKLREAAKLERRDARRSDRGKDRERSTRENEDRRGETEKSRQSSQFQEPHRETRKTKSSRPVPSQEETKVNEQDAAERAAFLYGSSKPNAIPVQEEETTKKHELPTGPVDRNKLAAKALRAKMMGNMKEFKILSDQLEASEADAPEESFVRTTHVHKGNTTTSHEKDKTSSSDKVISLKDLVEQERLGGEDMDSIHASNILRLGGNYKGTELGGGRQTSGLDEEDQVDVKMFEKSKEAQDKHRKAITSATSWDKALSRCHQCTNSTVFKKPLLLALGQKTYLSYPSKPTLGNGHVLLSTLEHIPASNACDEEVWSEIVKFKQALHRMFRSENQGVIFLEKTMHPSKRRHTVIECIAVPLDVEADAALYFRQALNEVDEEWGTHQKIIDTHQKGLKRSVPEGFAYFHVEWASGSYAHVIDDENQFPRDFGINVIAGMMEVDPPKYGNTKPTASEEFQQITAFLKRWEPFDWTKELEGGSYVEDKSKE